MTHSSYPTMIKNLMEDIQTGGDKGWWDMVRAFPESLKGSIAKGMWNDDKFSYGTEYGALIILNHILEVYQSSPTTASPDTEEDDKRG